MRLAAGIAERMALRPDDRIWTAIPLFHGGGITFAASDDSSSLPLVPPTAASLPEARLTARQSCVATAPPAGSW